jgi:hypothetical protein
MVSSGHVSLATSTGWVAPGIAGAAGNDADRNRRRFAALQEPVDRLVKRPVAADQAEAIAAAQVYRAGKFGDVPRTLGNMNVQHHPGGVEARPHLFQDRKPLANAALRIYDQSKAFL